MRSLPAISTSIFIVLTGLAWRLGQHLVTGGKPVFALVILVSGTVFLAATLRQIRRTLPASGVVIALCGASTLALRHIAWRLHDIEVSATLGRLAQGLVPGSGAAGGFLTFSTGGRLETVRLTFETLGLYEIWYIVVALLVVTAISTPPRAGLRLAGNLGIVSAYAIVRFLTVTALAIEWNVLQFLWHPAAAVISYLPLVLLLRPPLPSAIPRLLPGGRRQGVVLGVASVLAGVALAVVLGYADPGNFKPGRIMVDETHSNWEWTDTPFDTTSFGIRAEYNYYCLVEYLSHHYEIATNTDGISNELLDGVDVLVIKTPTEPFTPEEIKAITAFVRSGGGLLLVGDHTNLFGMTDFLNPIAERFAMRFRYDDTFDLASTGLSVFARPHMVFHPSVRGVDRFEFLTSCSAVGGAGTEPVMIGCGLGSEDVDYGHPNFFGNMTYDLCDRFGLFLQACSKRFGRGRVLLFTDSTCLSNFCLFGPGARELVLGFIDYLNRDGTKYPWVRTGALVVLGAICALLVIRLRVVRGGLGPLCIGLCAGLAVGSCGVSHINARLYGPLPLVDTSSVALFETEHTEASLFNYLGVMREPGMRGFEQFYLCARRIGMYPTAGTVGDIERLRPDGVVLIEPCTVFTEEELRCLYDYVRCGGRLLILDSVLNPGSTANQVLGRFGMMTYLSAGKAETSALEDSLLNPGMTGRPMSVSGIAPKILIEGGQALEEDGGNVVLAVANAGQGIVAVAVDSFLYSGVVLGPVLKRGKPTPFARAAHRNACNLLEQVFLYDL